MFSYAICKYRKITIISPGFLFVRQFFLNLWAYFRGGLFPKVGGGGGGGSELLPDSYGIKK